MKYGIFAMLIILLSACNGIGNSSSEIKKNLGADGFEKAKAILWVDKPADGNIRKYGSIRTVKVKAYVYSDGTFRIIFFTKKQDRQVAIYLKKRAAVYTIPKFFLDEGYITPGEQFLQLRYLPEKVRGN